MPPPPFLNPDQQKVHGLAFLGLSLARKSARGHPHSCTHQTAFCLDSLTDREYQHVLSTSDDGWLVGGGEPAASTKLTSTDSAHVELLHVSTFDPAFGGVRQDALLQACIEAQILIPEITVVPTAVVHTEQNELLLRFDMEAAYHTTESHNSSLHSDVPPLPVNWQLRFIHNQLFRHFQFPSRYCSDPFTCRLASQVEFRSELSRAAYLRSCQAIVQQWRSRGPQCLNPPCTKNVVRIQSPSKHVRGGVVGSSDRYTSGVWLFRDRHTPTHLVEPNFLPPYDTPEKREIIFNVLSEEWDAHAQVWKAAAPLPKPDLICARQQQLPHDDRLLTSWTCGAFESALCAAGK